jgi:hypothetical protein
MKCRRLALLALSIHAIKPAYADQIIDYLIEHPDDLCDEFGIAPKPYWILVLKIVGTQAILGMVFNKKPKTTVWWKEHPTRLQVFVVVHQVVGGILAFFAALSAFRETVPTSTVWENYEKVAYLIAQSSGTATCMQLFTIRCIGTDAEGAVEEDTSDLLPTLTQWLTGDGKKEEVKSSCCCSVAACKSHQSRIKEWLGAEQEWVSNASLYGRSASIMAVFLVVPLLTHALPMLFVYPWITLLLWGFLEAAHKLVLWIRIYEKREWIAQAALLLLFTAVLTYFATTCVGYAVLFYHYTDEERLRAENRTMISTDDYLRVISIETDSHLSRHYVRCLERQLSKSWTTMVDTIGMF